MGTGRFAPSSLLGEGRSFCARVKVLWWGEAGVRMRAPGWCGGRGCAGRCPHAQLCCAADCERRGEAGMRLRTPCWARGARGEAGLRLTAPWG